MALPEYALVKVEGDEHNQMFYVTCSINAGKQMTQGDGSNRRKAEQIAAKLMLEQLRAKKASK